MTPADDSAKDSIKALREAGASNELLARLNADLNQRLLAAARDAATRGDQAAVQANLNAARDNGVSAAALNAAQRDITAAAQKQQRTNDDIARYRQVGAGSPGQRQPADAGQRFGRVECRAPAPARRAQPDHRPGGERRAHAPDRRGACAPQRQQAGRSGRVPRCRRKPRRRCRSRRAAHRAGERADRRPRPPLPLPNCRRSR